MKKGMIMVKKNSNFPYDMFVGIATSVISALILSWVITPLSNWLFPKVLQIASKFSGTFEDYVYKRAAHITVESSSTLTLIVAYMTLSYVIWIVYYISLRAKERVYDLSDELIDILQPDKPDTETADISLEAEIKESERKKKRVKRIHILFSLSLFIGVLTASFMIMLQIYVSSISSKTLKRIDIVAPYISDQEYKQLKSDFFMIENKSDYDNLQKNINAIFEVNQLDLKE